MMCKLFHNTVVLGKKKNAYRYPVYTEGEPVLEDLDLWILQNIVPSFRKEVGHVSSNISWSQRKVQLRHLQIKRCRTSETFFKPLHRLPLYWLKTKGKIALKAKKVGELQYECPLPCLLRLWRVTNLLWYNSVISKGESVGYSASSSVELVLHVCFFIHCQFMLG